MKRLICAVAGLAILAATPAAASTCIRHDDIWNWSSPNDKTLILEDYRQPSDENNGNGAASSNGKAIAGENI